MVEYANRDDHRRNREPDTVPARFNVYAIWERPACGEWSLRYIGRRESNDGVIRLRQHLFHCPSGTWSKRLKVAAALEAGSDIAVSMVHVTPEPMRLAVEDYLIARAAARGDCAWNQKQKATRREKKRRPRAEKTAR